MLWDLAKILVTISIMRSPWLPVAILLGCALILLFGGIFIKFKNGYFSWICYFILLFSALGYSATSLYVLKNPPEDIKLKRAERVRLEGLTADGCVSTGRFRVKYYPLLGVDLSREDSVPLADAHFKEEYKNESLLVQGSRVYPGYVVSTESGRVLNESLLDNGIAQASTSAPCSYLVRQRYAQSRRLGIWAYSSASPRSYSLSAYFMAFCFGFFISCFWYVIYRYKTEVCCASENP